MRRASWYRVALAGAITIVLLNTWLAARALHTLIDAEFWQAHTLEVISQTEGLVAQVRTAESSALGYILTGLPAFQQQYATTVNQIHGSTAHLRRLTPDNASQQIRIGELSTRIQSSLGKLDAGMAMRRGHLVGELDPAMLAPVISDSPNRIDSVQAKIRDIESEEQRLLGQRIAAANSAHRQVWFSFTLAFVLDFLLLIAAFEQLIRAGRDREKIAGLNLQLTAINEDLEQRVEQRTRELEASNKELEAFSYSVSHDLRAPLRTIDGFSLALQEDFTDKLDEKGRDYISRVRNGVQRMGTLIDSLLQLSRVARSEVQREQIDLSQLATLVFSEIHAADPERTVKWEAQPDVTVDADPRLVRIALENLIGNAWKFTAKTPDATIAFGSSLRERQTVYFIRDNGAGFDMQYVDRLFTAFQRLHGEREFKGSGIGLATVSRIIHRHHGSIWAEASPGQGATFFFTLTA